MIEQLRLHGFTRMTLAVGYLSHLIEAVFGDGSAYGVSIDYHHERRPLGTAGALAGIEELDEPFLMMNGDVITTLDFGELLDAHVSSGNALTIATQVRRPPSTSACCASSERNGERAAGHRVLEKPTASYAVSMGVYVVSPRLLQLIEPDAYLDFPDLVLQALGAGGARRLVQLRRALARHRAPRGLRARDRGESGHSERPAPGLAHERRGPRARACPRARGRLTVATRSRGRAGAASPP